MTIEILATDARFQSSPDVGDPACLCSRCLKPIGEDEFALRAWPQVEKPQWEYRFCEACQEQVGIQHFRDENEAGRV